MLYQRFGHIALPTAVMAALLIISLLWPTFYMGASLPPLSRAVTDHLDRAAARVGTLYGMNTLGAAAGALISTWMLLRRWDSTAPCVSAPCLMPHARWP